MEGRIWHRIARDKFGVKIVPKMELHKYYLHQAYTTCFAEFESMEKLREFSNYADENLPYWDYDPVATIDTNDAEQVESWKMHIKKE